MYRTSILFTTLLVMSYRRYARGFPLWSRNGVVRGGGLSQISVVGPFSSTCHNRDSQGLVKATSGSHPSWRSPGSSSSLDRIPISFCQTLSTTTRLFSATTDATFSSSSEEDGHSLFLASLNPSQVEAVTQPLRAVTRVIAGPGSGKTKVLTCRIAYLLHQDPRNKVLAVTFTKKAAEEMRHRVETLLLQQQLQQQEQEESFVEVSNNEEDGVVVEDQSGKRSPDDMGRVTLGTFHSICAMILRFNGELLESLPSVEKDMMGLSGDFAVNLNGNFAIADSSDQLRLLKECIDEAGIDLKKTDVKPMRILTSIGAIKEAEAQGTDLFAQYKDAKNKVPIPKPLQYAKEIYSLYRQKLLSNNALDFDDLILMTREVLLMYPDLRDRLHRRWPHVLVDEFQDTSIIQMDLVKLLTSSSLFVVGDADQSIYAWRGAQASSLSDVRSEFEEFAENGVHSVYLMENYRSTSNIVNAAEKVISGDVSKGKVDDPRRAMTPQRGSGPSPRIVACADERAEAQFVVETIVGLKNDLTLTSESSVAIIYRTNSQSRFLEEACVSKNLPYVIQGGAGGFYKRAEVKDCLCFLRWLYNGNDESAMIRAFQTPSRGLGDKAIAAFKTYCGAVDSFYRESSQGAARASKLDILLSMTGLTGTSLVQGAPEPSDYIPKRALNNFLPFAGQMNMLKKKAYTSPVDSLLFDIIGELDLLSHFDSISKSKNEFEERRENVQELRRATERYSTQGPSLVEHKGKLDMDDSSHVSPLGAFLDDVALVNDVAADEGGAEDKARFVIKLMTIHASKGTEYDAVFLVGNEEGTLPSHLSIQEGEDSIALQEERRLCYVAMTRAKTHLVMTWRKEVSTFSGWSALGPKTVTKSRSRFLDALAAKGKGGKLNSSSTGPKTNKSVGPAEGLLNGSTGLSPAGQSPKRRIEATTLRSNPGEVTRPRRADGSSTSRSNIPQSARPSTTGGTVSQSANDFKSHTNSKTSTQEVRRSLSPSSYSQSSPRITAKTFAKSVVAAKSETFDSTFFYPVGSEVIHHNFGKGKVLDPSRTNEANKSLVRVAFDNGRTMEFPVEARDLFPVF